MMATAEPQVGERAWLHQVALECRYTTLAAGFQVNNCIQSTRLGVDVLKHYGLNARPQPVRVAAWNAKGIRMHLDHVPLSEWPEDAWGVGIGGTGLRNGSGWDGHLVIVLRNPDRKRTLIDLSADQLSRPQRDIFVGGPVFMDLPQVWAPGDMLYSPMGSQEPLTVLGYEPQANAGDWRSAPDWIGHHDIHTAMVEEVVRRLDGPAPGASPPDKG